ncbi:MAG: sulfotransferase family 2 domain-containing protein [Phycisphaerales bacterium]|nr:sulfotransferase family 2 domain-containing protein [Phycisphaerales bacterium]
MPTTWRPHGPLAPEEQLYFLHIPKTAGTSFRTFLELHFDVAQICPHLLLPALLPVPPSTLAAYRLICGHHGLYLNHLLPRKPVTLTVLRDPVARTVSHFRHLQATKDDWLHEAVKGMSFEEFVCSDIGVVELLNLQTRYLALDDIQQDFFGHSRLRTDDLPGLVRKYSDPALVEKGKAQLDSLAFIGIQERFADSLRLASHTFGWAPASSFASYNTAKAGFDATALTPKALERVNELTRIDRELYDYALAAFERRLAALSPAAEEADYRNAMRQRPRVDRVAYGFDRAINGDNWMAMERRRAASRGGPGHAPRPRSTCRSPPTGRWCSASSRAR